ncbi:MAG TPA: hypothetical protein VMU88_05330, partial [bacterium]|nr:hypothetical protein [bacterium]
MKSIVRKIKTHTTNPAPISQPHPTANPNFDFCLLSAFQGLMVFLFVSRIWLDLVQLKPDNKTPQYELYLLSWVFLPLLGTALARLTDRFCPTSASQLLYRRIFVFFNFILVLGAYWDVQTAYPWPL